MIRLTIRKWVYSFIFIASAATASADNDLNQVDGPNVRVLRNEEDGSRMLFLRSADNRTVTKKTFNANGVLILVTIYRTRENGDPLSCKIFDGEKQELFKVSYGYRKSDGQLVEERMFDSRVKRTDPNGNIIPVRRFIYTYDGQGKRSRGQAITLIPGQTADEVYRRGAADPDLPFKGPEKPTGQKPAPSHR